MTSGSRWRRVGVFLVAVVITGLGGYVGCDIAGGRRVAEEIAKIESQHGILAPAASGAPAIASSENRAALVKAAASLVNPSTDQAALSKFLRDPARKTVTPPLRSYLESNAEAVRLARQFVARRKSSFGVDHQSQDRRPPLLEMRQLSHLLYIATLQAMEAGQPDEVAALIAAGLFMSSACRNEPDLITQLVRIAMADAPIDALQRFFEDGQPTKAGLAQVAAALAENREPAPLTIGLRSEAAYGHYAFSHLEAGRDDAMASNIGAPFRGWSARLMRPMLRWAHARYLEEVRSLLDVQTGPRPRPAMTERSNPPPWAFIDRLSSSVASGLRRAIATGDDFTSQLVAAELAVALRRHKLDHGSYPDALSALAPAYVPTVFIDPHTGKTPIYARAGDGFTLKMAPSENYAPTKRPLATWTIAK